MTVDQRVKRINELLKLQKECLERINKLIEKGYTADQIQVTLKEEVDE